MKNKFNLIITILVLLVLGSIVNAQPPTTCPNDPKVRIISAEQDLKYIEQLAKQIQTTATYSEENSEALLKLMDSYADNLTVAFEERLKSTERVARKNPKETREDVGGQLEIFENTAIEQSRRVLIVQRQLAEIEKSVEGGKIKTLPRTQTSNMNIFDQTVLGENQEETGSNVFGFQLINFERSKSLNKVKVAIPCVSPCKNKNWGACVACVVPISTQIYSKWNEYSSCNSGCDGKKWWQRPACRISCLSNFVSWIA